MRPPNVVRDDLQDDLLAFDFFLAIRVGGRDLDDLPDADGLSGGAERMLGNWTSARLEEEMLSAHWEPCRRISRSCLGNICRQRD